MRSKQLGPVFSKGAIVAAFLLATPVFAQTYTDLPGVRRQDPLNDPGSVKCEQVLSTRPNGDTRNNNPEYDTLYSCSRDGGPTFASPRLPPSVIRQLRGLDY